MPLFSTEPSVPLFSMERISTVLHLFELIAEER